MKYSIFHIEGGLGKHLAATAVARCIKENHPDRALVVVCGYPEIFLNLGFVDRVYRIGVTPYFYDDFIKDKDSIIFKHEPYYSTEHIHKTMPLIKSWCKTYGLEGYDNLRPELSFNVRQIQFGAKRWRRERPVMILQTNGGPMRDQPYPYAWARDMPAEISTQIVNSFSKEYHIIQVCRSQEQVIPGTEPVFDSMSNMELLSMLLVSQKRVLIDSCFQHAAAALNMRSTVLWVTTSPKVFGYQIHENITAKLPDDAKLPDSYLFDYNFHGTIHECPLKSLNIFDEATVINTIINT